MTFKDSNKEENVEENEDEVNIIQFFIRKSELFKRLRNVLIPLCKLAMHMKENYDFGISKDQAMNKRMDGFVEDSDDLKLKKLYQ